MWTGTVSQFIQFAQSGRLTDEIRRTFGQHGSTVSAYEEKAWDKSLPALARVLHGQGLDQHQIHILAEVALPGTSSRADVVLLGHNRHGGRGAVVLELKQWPQAFGAKAEQVTWGNDGQLKLHPSAQVQGYRDYLRLYAGALVDRTPASTVEGTAFLHNMQDVTPLAHGWGPEAAAINAALVADCPPFGAPHGPFLATWIRGHLPTPPAPDFVDEFKRLEKRASAQLVHFLKEIVNSNTHPWVLLDFQREAMAEIEDILRTMQHESTPTRRVIVVTGGPGSGKTILAVSILLKAMTEYDLRAANLVTTTKAQRETLQGEMHLVKGERVPPTRKLSNKPVRHASDFRLKKVDRIRGKKNSRMTDAQWDAYCRSWRDAYDPALTRLPDHDILIVDEAQGLVEPFKPYVDGSPSKSWATSYGPQAWHIMMRSRLSIFLMDAAQGYRQVESTVPEDIVALARQEGMEPICISLGNEQFRVNGGRAYVAWLDHLLGFAGPPPPLTPLEQERLPTIFAIDEHPGHMRDELKSRYALGQDARLLAGYAWEWVSKQDPAQIDSHDGLKIPDRLPPPGLSFQWADGEDGQRSFNLAQGLNVSPLQLFGDEDNPAIVGYPLTVRGRDIDHIGVLWGADLLRRDNHWVVNTDLVFGSDMPGLRKATRDELAAGRTNGPKMQELVRAVAGGYRILLTRGMQTVRLWIEDPETAAYVNQSWEAFLANRHPAQQQS